MSILVTAFDIYDQWQENSSWVALTEYLKEYGASNDIITRRYPVNLEAMRERLEADLSRGVSGVIHLGQSPGARALRLEAFCLNVWPYGYDAGGEMGCLIDSGPVAFRSSCQLGQWADRLRNAEVPAEVSYHAGTYLCNAIMYLTHAWMESRALEVPVAFIHTPLTALEADRHEGRYPGLQPHTLASGVRVLIELMRTNVAARVIS